MSEDKMRYEFDAQWRELAMLTVSKNPRDYVIGHAVAYELWKSCAAIKDAEIAAQASKIAQLEANALTAEKVETNLNNAVAARDLMIKELREAITYALVDVPEEEDRSIEVLKEALAKSEHHNSKVLAHVDDIAVDSFAVAMKAKLAAKRKQGKSGWQFKDACSNQFLSDELVKHISKGDPVDVANFCMMIQQRGETIDSKVLEKMLLEAELKVLNDARKTVKWWEKMIPEREAKLVDLNNKE